MEKYSGMIIHNIIYIIGYKNDLVSYFVNKKINGDIGEASMLFVFYKLP